MKFRKKTIVIVTIFLISLSAAAPGQARIREPRRGEVRLTTAEKFFVAPKYFDYASGREDKLQLNDYAGDNFRSFGTQFELEYCLHPVPKLSFFVEFPLHYGVPESLKLVRFPLGDFVVGGKFLALYREPFRFNILAQVHIPLYKRRMDTFAQDGVFTGGEYEVRSGTVNIQMLGLQFEYDFQSWKGFFQFDISYTAITKKDIYYYPADQLGFKIWFGGEPVKYLELRLFEEITLGMPYSFKNEKRLISHTFYTGAGLTLLPSHKWVSITADVKTNLFGIRSSLMTEATVGVNCYFGGEKD